MFSQARMDYLKWKRDSEWRMYWYDSKLNPYKGPLRMLNVVRYLQSTLGRGPTREEVQLFLTLKYDCTAKNTERFTELKDVGFLDYDTKSHQYTLTKDGEDLLKHHEVTVEMLHSEKSLKKHKGE